MPKPRRGEESNSEHTENGKFQVHPRLVLDRVMVKVISEHLRRPKKEGLVKGTSESILVKFQELKIFVSSQKMPLDL